MKTISLVLILTHLSAQLAWAASAPTAAAQPAPEPDLAPGFLIQLTSAQDPNINGQFRIQEDGTLELPYNVTISTLKVDFAGLEKKIVQAYQPYFKGIPNVQTTVKQKRYWIEIHGLISKPGSYLVKRDSSLDEIISMAGGLDRDSGANFAKIAQDQDVRWVNLAEYFQRGRGDEVPLWRGGDHVFIQRERTETSTGEGKIQVMGGVRSPGEFTFKSGADGYYYLSRAGGPTEQADLGRLEVIRKQPDGVSHRSVFVGDIQGAGKLTDGDLLIVHPARQSGFERSLQTTAVITSILTSVLTAAILVRVSR